MKILSKAVLPIGFKAEGISCGIKRSGKKDLALIYSDSVATAVGVFTTNKIKAAPVIITAQHIKNGRAQAIIANSGNANCMTKAKGLNDAKAMASSVAKVLNIKTSDVLVASTGIIGKPMPIDKIKTGISYLTKKINKNGLNNVAAAIMTTDTAPKKVSVKVAVGGKSLTITGIAKGAGMIAPNMATMLSFIVTDAAIPSQALKKLLKESVDNSFNSITIDACMSTNDMVLVLANGKARNMKLDGADLKEFSQALSYVFLELAKKIVKDAEGATKFVQINVSGAKNDKIAKTLAFAVANSNLLKTAIYGENRNLGRIFAALGQTGINIIEDKIKVNCSSLKKKNIKIDINLGMGKSEATVYTSDLSEEYVRINARYN
ncbi:MAG: bifunctional glutamate N-acetyltransferase/amino-acid acetyltransferase ArgJ [Candidatus Omnitrophica bacterium]|nr:bifunctional glutamate N-acetyltransferase/amino-acid acetyltransferase ArgJ [Candidatus Omnitrophota bacterium]HOX54863.1 bifunctional glutamate N-acetyltransferase/amino-acid acetyltransferase ArgJ [Candidatus Omnitrophota bacterium]